MTLDEPAATKGRPRDILRSFLCTPNGGRQFLSNRRSNSILYHCVGNLTVYLLENSNLSCVDRHLGYMKKLRSRRPLRGGGRGRVLPRAVRPPHAVQARRPTPPGGGV
jgi:hypothetical protein